MYDLKVTMDGTDEDIKKLDRVEKAIPPDFKLWCECAVAKHKIYLGFPEARANIAKDIWTYVRGRLMGKKMPRTWLRNKPTRAR
jgi:hypothetical protein